ncbi:MAG: hypothetical protein COX43_01345 [Parcubacteria group bacterium CG23_combo_of_CG06-09_8_20_14_all_35_9]|nr:MAG: hypothetical protein COX43_01345 [Parcubacteria group bacterium CG23_combo_of_CG06-09_8_20_14_all_35_9]
MAFLWLLYNKFWRLKASTFMSTPEVEIKRIPGKEPEKVAYLENIAITTRKTEEGKSKFYLIPTNEKGEKKLKELYEIEKTDSWINSIVLEKFLEEGTKSRALLEKKRMGEFEGALLVVWQSIKTAAKKYKEDYKREIPEEQVRNMIAAQIKKRIK